MYFLIGLTKEELPYKTALQFERDEPHIQRTSELLSKIDDEYYNTIQIFYGYQVHQ